MTLPFERKAAVKNTQQFLRDLMNPSITPRVPKEIRQRARSLLKHYPHDFEMDRAGEEAQDIFGDWKND